MHKLVATDSALMPLVQAIVRGVTCAITQRAASHRSSNALLSQEFAEHFQTSGGNHVATEIASASDAR